MKLQCKIYKSKSSCYISFKHTRVSNSVANSELGFISLLSGNLSGDFLSSFLSNLSSSLLSEDFDVAAGVKIS